jgi:hypothetical protein
MLQYSLNRSKRQNKKIETHSKVLGKYDGCIDQYNIEYSDEYDRKAKVENDKAKTDAKSAFMQRVATQTAGFWAMAQAVADASVYKKDDFEEILSESEMINSQTEESEYNPSDSEDHYSEYNQLETESVETTDSVKEDYEDLSDEYDRKAKVENDKAKTDAKSAFMQRVATQTAGFWAMAQAVADASVYKKDDFEEILSESEMINSQTEESEYNPSDSEDHYSEYDQLETESVVSTDSVKEDYEDLSDEYLSDGDSDYDPETDSYE